MTFTSAERAAMARALDLAASPDAPLGPNPRVGCVVLDGEGHRVAEGYHRGAGTPHAEVAALARAGGSARGATAVVTLEPCAHTGRTGPCTEALVAAGVRRVVFAQADPDPVASGGAGVLREAGVEVAGGLLAEEARALNAVWAFAVEHGRPFVTWKLATTLDGRVAAADGSSRWISGRAARADSHRLRALCDVVLVGTGTVEADDPALTVRDADDRPSPSQPLRAVMGERALEPRHRIFDAAARTERLVTRDPAAALAQLFALERRHVLLEGGPTLAAAFLRAGLVDEVVAYVAPVLLGAGLPAVGDLGISTIGAALRPRVTDVRVLADDADDAEDAGPALPDRCAQPDVRLTMTPHRIELTATGGA